MIGDKIKQIRKMRGLSQVQLAELAGITDRTLYNYEKNKRVPTLEILKDISETLKVSILELLESEITTIEVMREIQRRDNLNDTERMDR